LQEVDPVFLDLAKSLRQEMNRRGAIDSKQFADQTGGQPGIFVEKSVVFLELRSVAVGFEIPQNKAFFQEILIDSKPLAREIVLGFCLNDGFRRSLTRGYGKM
jgi:hypothetical protein